jgi:protein phosphatase
MVVIESAGITDVGKKREGNEDALYLDDNQQLYVVADGMGGHQAGEVASALVVDTVTSYMKRFMEEDQPDELTESDETLSTEANRLISGIRLANKAVYDIASGKEEYRGMGSTVSLAFFTEDTLIVANVGDSPVFLVHNDSIEQLSVTHNVITEQMAIDPEGAKTIGLQFRHMLTRAMGIEASVEPSVCEIQVFAGDMLLISSDGLTDKVSPEEILEVLRQNRPEKTCRQLVDLANDRGGDDNITIIALQIKESGNARKGFWTKLLRFINPFA